MGGEESRGGGRRRERRGGESRGKRKGGEGGGEKQKRSVTSICVGYNLYVYSRSLIGL
jgi:hypothetical protein